MAHVSDFRGVSTIFARFSGLHADLTSRYAQYRVYRKTLDELQSLSNRELNDLGLNRGVLRSIAHEAAYK